jgi:hypothetical protein
LDTAHRLSELDRSFEEASMSALGRALMLTAFGVVEAVPIARLGPLDRARA